MKPDQERVKTLLADTVTLLCRNGLHFQRQLRVQGVLGITVDDTDVFIVHINESFTDQGRGARLADFQGPLGSGFTAQLVATLSGQPSVNSVTPGQQAINHPLPKWQAQQKHKAADVVDTCQLNAASAMKRAKVDMQYANVVQENKEIIKDNQSSLQQTTVALPVSATVAAQWQFDTVQKIQQQNQHATVAAETPCYLSYSAGSSVVANSVSVSKRKANVYPPPQAMLAMSFGGLTSNVDYGNNMLQSGTLQQPNRDLCSTNNVHTSSTSKLWNDSAGPLAVQQQQQQLANDEQRLSATPVYDPLTGCTTWTVQHLVDGQGLHQMKAEDRQQQSTLDVQMQELNPLGILSYAPSGAADGEAGSVVGTDTASAQRKHQRSKESRRSWTSKHKPYACRHPGCRRSYFFVHDLRRHLRQKHAGMDYNEENGQYEAAPTDDTGEPRLGGESPLSPHDDSDDQSQDSDDEVSMATASLVG